MKLIIDKNRKVYSAGTWGTKNENNYEILDFEFPEELDGYNKRIVYYLGDERVWDAIVDNKAYITNAITTKGDVKAYVWCTKENTEREADTDFRTMLFEMHFYENENADGIVPTEEQVDGFNTMLTAMNAKIDEVDALETTIGAAEAERQEAEATRVSNENTRQSNESTRQTNEQTRQTQEADRERRTNEAISSIQDKTAEYNANAEAKTTAFNNNATQKTNDFNNNYTQKVNDFNTNASSKELAFNSNAESKTSTFNTNATNKTNDFNSNASSKTTAFNNNATSKTTDFNTNAENKTTAFNDNATQKTTNFNNNAAEKTDEFNNNAQEKIDEYDEHIVEYQAQIDELQEEVEELSENMPWSTTEQATEISVDDAAKYSRNKLELFGNTSQDSTTGKNLIPTQISLWEQGTITNGDNVTSTTRIRTADYYPIENDKDYCISIQDSNYCFLNIILYDNNKEYVGQYYSISADINGARNKLINIPSGTMPNVAYYRATVRNTDNTATIIANEIEIAKPQIELGSTATAYEPYTNGPAPNPDYPQDIHVVTGNNTISIQGKNLLPANQIRTDKDWLIVNDDGSVTINYPSGNALDQINLFSTPINIPESTYRMKIFVKGTFKGGNLVLQDINGNWGNQRAITDGQLFFISSLKNMQIWEIYAGTNCTIKFELEEGTTEPTEYQKYYHADYPINLGSIELCKIGDYQDYLYKENGNWYKSNTINKIILDGTTKKVTYNNKYNEIYQYGYLLETRISPYDQNKIYVISNIFQGVVWSGNWTIDNSIAIQNNGAIRINTSKFSNANDINNYFEQNNLQVYYILSTPTTTQITDETLISQLDAIYEHLKLVKGTNNITVTASDLAPYMKLTYMQDLPSKLDNLDSRLSLLE